MHTKLGMIHVSKYMSSNPIRKVIRGHPRMARHHLRFVFTSEWLSSRGASYHVRISVFTVETHRTLW
jgi:hypothetical protein